MKIENTVPCTTGQKQFWGGKSGAVLLIWKVRRNGEREFSTAILSERPHARTANIGSELPSYSVIEWGPGITSRFWVNADTIYYVDSKGTVEDVTDSMTRDELDILVRRVPSDAKWSSLDEVKKLISKYQNGPIDDFFPAL